MSDTINTKNNRDETPTGTWHFTGEVILDNACYATTGAAACGSSTGGTAVAVKLKNNGGAEVTKYLRLFASP